MYVPPSLDSSGGLATSIPAELISSLEEKCGLTWQREGAEGKIGTEVWSIPIRARILDPLTKCDETNELQKK